MKRISQYAIAASVTLSIPFAVSMAGTSTESEVPDQSEPHEEAIIETDSVQPGIMLLSDNDGTPSFFDGVIPPSPQAAAIAKYAEYPVSHTTGIPDISVPLYEIDLGGFVLPISISYHASGSKPDQIPTCVGLGWCLNAGGAISRTVLGAPDMYFASASQTDYRYYSRDNFKNMIKVIQETGGGPEIGHLFSILGNSHEWDTESDRYTFNVAGKTGVFRYSHADGKYIVLNNSNDVVTSYGKTGVGITFRIRGTDGVTYDFCKEENTGTIDSFNEQPFTSTWYVTLISTPYGNIKFTYVDATAVDVHCHSLTATSGPVRIIKEQPSYAGGVDYIMSEEYRIGHSNSDYTISYGQKLLKKIEWDGNRIEFEYIDEHPYKTLQRMTTMKVYNSAGDLRKTVTFDNTDNWPTDNSLTGRRLLKSVTDSEQGIWKFEYNKQTKLPALTQNMGSPACESDLWGYLNTTNKSTERNAFTEDQIKWLLGGVEDYTYWTVSDIQSVDVGYRDRTPNLACTLAGVLEKVTVPTGGIFLYEYELNRLGSKLCGGLRVKSVTAFDNASSSGRKTTYGYDTMSFTTEDPELLMNYYTHVQITRGASSPTIPEQNSSWPYSYRTSSVFPVNPVTASSSPVLYNFVTETRDDGSRTEYIYDEKELTELFGVSSDKLTHPSLFQQSVWDFGNREPLLKSKTVYDDAGKIAYLETYEYLKEKRKTFSAGIRTACPYNEFEVPENVWCPRSGISTYNAAHFGMVQYTVSTAFSRVCLLKRKTVTDTSGFSTITDYTYDTEFRTMSPRSISTTGSDGSILKTEYTFPFDHQDDMCRHMVDNIQTDCPVETSRYVGSSLIAREVTSYSLYNSWYYPESTSSWSIPTGTAPGGSVMLTEREKVGSYNSKGRPLSVKVNDTDETSFTWGSSGVLLESSTAPGGLKTTYTHKPLFGLVSVTLPNGYATSYSYNAAGMLQSISDKSGAIEEYTYSYTNHPKLYGDGNSVSTHRKLDASGTHEVLTKQYYSGLGFPTTLVKGGMNTKGEYLYSTTGYDNMGRPVVNILPGAGGKTPKFKSYNEIDLLAKETHGEDYARSQTNFDALERPVKVTTPGDAWHAAGKGKVTQYISNAASSVRLYRAPMTAISLVENGYYAPKTLQGVRTVDEDGKEITVYTDRLGRKVLERRGPESKRGQNDTYFVYNDLGQLRYVLSPAYQEDANQTEYVYEYRYDRYGNVVYKAIPGAGYTQYWYDRAGRLAYMQDANLRSKSLYRFFLYDKAGRQAIQGVCKVCTRDETVNFATYTGGTGGFMSTGYTLANSSRIQQATLETVSYFDNHTFASYLDTDIAKSSTQSCKGLLTGSVVYNSDDTKSSSAFYYDGKGQLIESRERTSFGTLRTTTNTYTYSGQPLKSTVTEGSVTTITENTYDPGSGLLTATDVTINGTKQRVSAVSYDDLGRIASVTRGAEQNSGGKVSYTYNIHGQTTSITGPGFSQNLYYADGPGNKLYNGSVSAMAWKMDDSQTRGYKYSYNDYNWLTEAAYGEGESLGSNKNRYSEKFTSFTRNGGVKELFRNGLKADGTYGNVDFLNITYRGNRIYNVSEGAPAVTQNGSMDFPGGAITSLQFTYNDFGALTADPSRGISVITYDNLGNPTRIQFASGQYITNVYSANGEKLKTTSRSLLQQLPFVSDSAELGLIADMPTNEMATSANYGLTKTEYHGPVIYRNGIVDMVLFPGGYATISGATITFHYYTQDYLGNNRAVINGSTGAIEQTVAYYPYGGIIANLGTAATTGQPYKFGGKELMTANGLNEYDFGARQYYSAVPGFFSIDKKCEKTPWLSPYLYCANNPVNAFDPDGNVVIFVNGFHMGDGGQAKYWNGIDAQIMNVAGDNKAIYYDGAMGGVSALGNFVDPAGHSQSNLNLQDRIEAGYEKGYSECQTILNLSEESGSPVKFVSHSMGGAYTKGLIQGMMKFAEDNKIDINGKLAYEVDFAPFQSSEQTPVIEKTIVFQHSFDGVAGDKPIQGATNIVTHQNPTFNLFNAFMLQFNEHSISSFSDDISKFWDRFVK
ncbi:MAG: hypothetical protein K2L45_12860 [Muribaculaceae bacterium]|nr:hypothetical protein [Muribaculaceae bacterium]